MPLTHHDDIELVAGDDWVITAVLLDVNGSSLDITNASFEWTLIDTTGTSVAVFGDGSVTVVVINPGTNGQLNIKVPKSITSPLLSGRFHDALRVTINYTSTFWMGAILVDGDPFSLIPSFTMPEPVLISSGLESGSAGIDSPILAAH